MTRLHIKHSTGFSYGGKVNASYNEARMLPVTTEDQYVLCSHIDIQPMASQSTYIDYWGMKVSAFEVLTPHEELSLTATSLVEVRPRKHEPHPTALGAARHRRPRPPWTRWSTWNRPAAPTPPTTSVELARTIADRYESPCEAAMAISREIGEQMDYVQGVTGVHSTAAEAWANRKGVCQDITHIVLGALRSVGIPARYVSGYLHPKPHAAIGETVTGESHAWVEWFCGDWRGFDPTNWSTWASVTSSSGGVVTTATSPRCAGCTRAPTARSSS